MGRPVFLHDIWPGGDEVQKLIASSISSRQFDDEYSGIFKGDAKWQGMPAPQGAVFEWDPDSTYIREPPFFIDIAAERAPARRHRGGPGAGAPRRLDNHRPHLPRRHDPAELAGRQVPAGTTGWPRRTSTASAPAGETTR